MNTIDRIFNSGPYRDGEFTIAEMCAQCGPAVTKGSVATALKKAVSKGQLTCRSARNGVARINYYKAVKNNKLMRTAWVSTPTPTEYTPEWH